MAVFYVVFVCNYQFIFFGFGFEQLATKGIMETYLIRYFVLISPPK